MIDQQYDAFLSYHGDDIDAVTQIAGQLKNRDIKVWWDQWHLRPGTSFQQKLDEGLRNCGCTIVVLGPNGIGAWQRKEIEFAVLLSSQRHHAVIPVFLPGAQAKFDARRETDVPANLQIMSAVMFQNSLAEEETLGRLVWGITGKRPDPPPYKIPPPSLPEQVSSLEETATDMVQWLKEYGGVTFFLGDAASGESKRTPPRSYEIARDLLSKMRTETEDRIPPPLDFAATYYALRNDEAVLERTVVGLIQERSEVIPNTHQRLSELLLTMQPIRPPRGRRPFKQLIFTTNLDLIMERALVRAGIEFARLVQHRSDTRIYLSVFRDLPDEMRAEGFDEVDKLILGKRVVPRSSDSIILDEFKGPVLYKFRGSEDISDSCVLTSSQSYEFAKAVLSGRIVPKGIESVLANTRLLFLGCSLLDHEMRLTHHTLLSEPLRSSHQKYMVQLPPEMDPHDPYRHLELGIWNKVKETAREQRIKIIEARDDEFLFLLREKLT